MCGIRETLGHVLNSCNVMLNQGRYTWRHDNVLLTIKDFIQQIAPPTYKLQCDIGDSAPGTIPLDILTTNERPELVVVDYNRHKMKCGSLN